MPPVLAPDQLARDLALRDLTDPAAGPHGVQLLVDLAVDALARAWGLEVRVERGPRVVPVADNYDRLRYPPEAVTRDARYTRYVREGWMLRSHSSAMIPPALARVAAAPADDVLLVCPGITYRRDAIDRLHTGTPHQLDLWRVSRRPLGAHDLEEMQRLLAAALVPGRRLRSEPRVHPYTLDGRQTDVLERDGWVESVGRRADATTGRREWVEVWECGLAHPDVLAGAGLDGWSGLALGMGLDRLLMLRKGVPDIRLLRSRDPRVAGQMADLAPYRPVSDLPAIARDLSIAVPAGDDAEQLGDRVRDALGPDADLVEAVAILSETPYDDLPPAARHRLGIDAGQKNVLVRVVIRPLERTLTDREANALRDRIHAAVHRGRRGSGGAAS